jgi:hypothetical protein
MDTINFKIDITNPDLVDDVNKIVASPLNMLPGDILKLNYDLSYDAKLKQILETIEVVRGILKDPTTGVNCEFQKLIDFRNDILKLNALLEDVEIEVAAKCADGSVTKKVLIERLSQPGHKPSATEEAFVEAVLRAT